MTDPLELMKEIEYSDPPDEERTWSIHSDEWKRLRTALEAQLCRFNEETSELRDELAQAHARIARLEEWLEGHMHPVGKIVSVDTREEIKDLLCEHPRQSAAALNEKAFRDHAFRLLKKGKRFEVDDPRGEKYRVAYMFAVKEADRIEREAKEQVDE